MKKTIIFLILLAPVMLMAQTEYIYPGETKTITATDTSYVITISQMRQCIMAEKNSEILQDINTELKEKISVMVSQKANLEELLKLKNKDVIFYRTQWEAAEKDVKTLSKEAARQRRLKYLFGGSGILIGLLISAI